MQKIVRHRAGPVSPTAALSDDHAAVPLLESQAAAEVLSPNLTRMVRNRFVGQAMPIAGCRRLVL
jgi:hypothetical protein